MKLWEKQIRRNANPSQHFLGPVTWGDPDGADIAFNGTDYSYAE